MVSNLSDDEKLAGPWTIHTLPKRWRWIPFLREQVTLRATYATWDEVYGLIVELEQHGVPCVAHPGPCRKEPPS